MRLSPRAQGAVGLTVVGLALAAGGALAWGSLVERRRYTLRHHAVRTGASLTRPLRLLHLSDLHTAPWQEDKAAWVGALAQTTPDLVVVTGDFFGHPDALPRIRQALMPFAGIPGIFVFGSNDYWVATPKNPFAYFAGPSRVKRTPGRLDTEALKALLVDDVGWVDVNNAATRLTIGEHVVDIVGVDDPHLRYDRSAEALAALERLRSGGSAALTLGVTHAPYRRVLNDFTSAGCDLIVAGHTHGGQVCVPGFGALVTNCDIPRDQASGLSTWAAGDRATVLNVSAGIGTSIYAPVRFACPPEASLIDLVPNLVEG